MSSKEALLAAGFNEAQTKLVIQTADLPLGTLADMVESGSIDLQPLFQRRERWATDKQSALIESFLLNVPVPPIYLAEEHDGTYTAIDGKQRLKAISDFMKGRFALSKLDRLKEAEGFKFSNLPPEIVNALKLRPFIRVVTLLKQSDQLLKYEVFLRLNRGGESLNAQEIRNVAFRGPLNDAIVYAARADFLRQQLKIESDKSAAFRDMSDAEYVLRYITLRESVDNFSGNLVGEMDRFMRENAGVSEIEAVNIVSNFDISLYRCQQIWGEFAFRRPEGANWRDQTLAGMYDAQMVAAGSLSQDQFDAAVKQRSEVLSRTRALFSDADFDKAVRTGTNTPARIRYRVEQMKRSLQV
jgi:hypothetical protein